MATANVVDESIPDIVTVVAKHQTALALGGRLTYWLSAGIGIEGGLHLGAASLFEPALTILLRETPMPRRPECKFRSFV